MHTIVLRDHQAEMLPAVFYINRACDIIRRHHIEAQLAGLPLRATRISAVNGRDVPSSLQVYFPHHDRLSAGEVGCYASHMRVAQLVCESHLPLALVLEDDAIIKAGFLETLMAAIRALPQGWDLLHLSGNPRQAIKPLVDLGDHRIVRYSRVPTGTVAYLITLEGARKLLRPLPRRWPIDTDIRQPWQFGMDVLGISPPIVEHNDHLASAISSFGQRSRLRRGLHPLRGSVTGNPFKTTESFWFNCRKLGPVNWLRCMYSNSAVRLLSWAEKAIGANVSSQN